MLANYVTVDYATRSSLGNTTAYAAAVLADWVGLLTGTITSTSQLSSYADKANCSIQGAAGDWTVYDADAHYSYSGIAKVLRRPCADGVSYQYMWIGLRCPSADALNGVIALMGGWNSANKAPTTAAVPTTSSGATLLAVGTVFDSTNVPMSTAASSTGTAASSVFNSGGSAVAPVPYAILSVPGVCAVWAKPVTGMTCFPSACIAEHSNSHPWINGAAGCPPLACYASSTTTMGNIQLRTLRTRTSAGTLVTPTYSGAGSPLLICNYSLTSGGQGNLGTNLPALDRMIIGAGGVTGYPVVPLDVLVYESTTPAHAYVGRLSGLFGTLQSLTVGQTFLVGGDTYIVLPVGGYATTDSGYSGGSTTNGAKLCAKVA